ncbi:hypothetical protein [Blastopirellula marina]|uniref:Uncharacterized protein n=1 Tax=Blastopirellula marina TaxID=124 RepID=A0A2S8F6R1_9BACT|nr:hypothetical protein [Blastopirellula marina]PQO27828.1 hypothetical protein C5Y98_26220 [Blastopirellula marina]PTL41563.1 hypothetical protein C5Y97_26235 [Blastopirellula marina]
MSDQKTAATHPPSFDLPLARGHKTLAIGVIAMGILISIFGTVVSQRIILQRDPQALLLTAPICIAGLALIVGQYLGISRGNRTGLYVANAILLPMSTCLFFIGFINPLFWLMSGVLVAAAVKNWDLLFAVNEAERTGLVLFHRTKWTLSELLGAMFVLALIFGPASYIVRSLDGNY